MLQASYRPSDTEVAQLMALLQQPGFEVLKKIQMAEVDFFQLDLLNTDPSAENYETLVRNRHSLALAAGMFYQRLQEKIAGYVNRLNEKHNQPPVLPDLTEEIFS